MPAGGRDPDPEGDRIKRAALLLVVLSLVLVAAAAAARPRRWPTPAWFYPQALCVHSGWHFARVHRARDADYIFGPGLAFGRTWDVDDHIPGGSGEGGWHEVDPPYRNGLQFTLGTWERAGGAASSWASASPAEQIYRAFRIVRGDGGSWREWPQTSRACGLR